MTIGQAIQALLEQSKALQLLEQQDEIYARNRILALLGLDDFHQDGEVPANEAAPLEAILNYAVAKGLIADTPAERDILESKIMDAVMPRPSEVNRAFYRRYQKHPEEATDYFYALSQHSRYIKMEQIRKNITYKVATPYGDLDITINLSKPEKDPKAIAREKLAPKVGYPACLLCLENEGYAGRINHPARSNHRVIRLDLLDEPWFMQYSPYIYYPEHCIVISEEHRPMTIDERTFRRLLAFVEKFPHYFIGSNADLPIVGGSILAHEHYQGGRYEFAMARAKDDYAFRLDGFPDVEASIIRWPMPVIRLRGCDAEALAAVAAFILERWKRYSDPEADVLAYSGNTPHNTITPIARRRGAAFELDLVLRNNRTSAEHPYGIFHPHEDVHHIKKENIGLIEVMGLAVLPGRLDRELLEVEKFLLDEANDIADYHLPWAWRLKEKYAGGLCPENVRDVVRREVGLVFLRVLEDAAVFKRDEKGHAALRRFLKKLNARWES